MLPPVVGLLQPAATSVAASARMRPRMLHLAPIVVDGAPTGRGSGFAFYRLRGGYGVAVARSGPGFAASAGRSGAVVGGLAPAHGASWCRSRRGGRAAAGDAFTA